MEREHAKHYVKLDDMMELTMKIPVHLDVLELKALMFKADKLFKLSEVQILQHKVAGYRRSEAIKTRQYKIYNKKVLIDLLNLKVRKVSAPKVADYLNSKYGEKLGMAINSKKVNAKYHYHNSVRKNINDFYDRNYEMPAFYTKEVEQVETPETEEREVKKHHKAIYTGEQEQLVMDLHNKGAKGNEITKKFNKAFGVKFLRRQLVDKVKHLVKTGRVEKYPLYPSFKQGVKSAKKERAKPTLFPPEVELVMVQLANDGHSSKEIRDAVNSQYGKHYSKKQVTDKVYNLKKQGRTQ